MKGVESQTPWNRVPLAKLRVAKWIRFPLCVESQETLPFSQHLATGPHSKAD